MQTVPSTVPSSLHSSRRLKRHLPLICATSIALFAGSVQAANQVWSPTPTDTNWTTGTNWVGGAAPGAVNGPSTDNALFNTALATGTFGAGTLGGGP